MNRIVLLGTLLLLFAAVPAASTAGAAPPDACERSACPFVRVGDDWACAGARVHWEGYGACAEAAPACVGSGSDRLYEEHCLVEESAAPTPAVDLCEKLQTCPLVRAGTDPVYACAGVAFGTGGVATCAYPEHGCVRQSWGYAYNEVCLASTLAPLLA